MYLTVGSLMLLNDHIKFERYPMDKRLNELQGRKNLYDDDFYEDFRDVLTDNAITDWEEGYQLRKPGSVEKFGNECRLETLTISPIDTAKQHKFVSKLIAPWGWHIDKVQLIHSFLHLHMQAEEEIKIDIIWSVDELNDPDQAYEYSPIAVFFEDNGQGAFDDGPNFDPMHNANWDEFLYDMGIGPDPYSGQDH